MILTVTLNPAVDRTCRVECLAPGRVNRMKSVCSVAGGKGINVARVLRSFHMPAAAAGFLGGSGGRFIGKSMGEAGVECHFIQIRGGTRTNKNILGGDGGGEGEKTDWFSLVSGFLGVGELGVGPR